MSDIVERAKKLLDGTTPGPWHWTCGNGDDLLTPSGQAILWNDADEPILGSSHDCALIAAAPTIIAELVAEIERLRAPLAPLEDFTPEELDRMAADPDVQAELKRLWDEGWT